jgi:hypothetical protein
MIFLGLDLSACGSSSSHCLSLASVSALASAKPIADITFKPHGFGYNCSTCKFVLVISCVVVTTVIFEIVKPTATLASSKAKAEKSNGFSDFNHASNSAKSASSPSSRMDNTNSAIFFTTEK